MRAADIRSAFIEFFRQKRGHTIAVGSPVVPFDDPTLLFTNAGMNQFKDVFLGRGTRPYTRAVNSQKCIRAGGKHNDLEDVGRDVYHHTFFEMLGNWSFGDYFKEESIAWGWELLTDVYGLDPARLYATYFGGDPKAGLAPDEEARAIWCRFLPAHRVIPGSMKDNFWEMGETGPCGPCSEIHFDRIGGRDAALLVNAGDPDVLEIWNHVFIQFNREADGSLKQLPSRHVDTGMGLERLVSVIQDKRSNYDTDLWTPIFDAIRGVTGGRAYGGKLDDPIDIAYRIIADHVRCLTAAACDGAGPGSDGRNYVLRRILRRAARHGRQTFGIDRPFVYELVPAVVATLGEAFPEITAGGRRAADIIRAEEELFGRTLGRGIALFEESALRGARLSPPHIAATDAFRLHDTWGFPIDLTQVMASERGMTVDVADYERLMERARQTSRAGDTAGSKMELPPDALAAIAAQGAPPTDDSARDAGLNVAARIAAIWNGSSLQPVAQVGGTLGIVLDRTCFYAESGGQEADHGSITTAAGGEFEVADVQRFGDFVLHMGVVKSGTIRVGDAIAASLCRTRRDAIAANHTTTHLLNLALRAVVGEEVQQRGSLV
ncbi:MAG: alanine--tRNA ligase, partial [Phycisphaerales bacterium]|nr:alanine--tRNA ligase [Phycisphaerales bacterium]